MEFCEDLKGLLLLNENISSVWVNEDASEWHTHEVEGLKEVKRETILKPKSKNGTK